VPSHLGRLQDAVAVLPEGVLAPSLPLDFVVKAPVDFGTFVQNCIGTGLYVSGGAYVHLSGSANMFNSNARAGISVTDIASYVEGQNVWAQLNGISGPPPPHNDVALLLESGYCMGGIQVRQQGFVNLDNVYANGNNFFGVIIHHGGMSFFNEIHAHANADLSFGNSSGDGMVAFGGSLAAQNFTSLVNERSGVLIQTAWKFVMQNGTWVQTGIAAQFFLSNGLSSLNSYGIVTDVCDIENYLAQHSVTVSGNSAADIYIQLPCSLSAPPPPPLPGK
jgi:hypothetical protein